MQTETLSDGPDMAKKSADARLDRTLGLADAVSMVVGIILGSGIFVAPATVAALAPHPAMAAGLWGCGALIAGCGAMCYAECGARLPHDGGFFVFFERAFSARVAFVAGWAALFISYPTSLAGVTKLGVGYLPAAWPAMGGHQTLFALGLITAAAVLNAVGVALGRFVQRLLTAAKLLAIVGVVGCALWVFGRAEMTPHPTPETIAPLVTGLTTASMLGLLLQALATLMWTYDGWTDITMVAGEVKDPERNLARAVVLSLAVLFVVYAAVQVAVMLILGAQEAAQSDQVLALALDRALGPKGGQTVAWLVLLTTAGSVHGLLFATSRLAYAMAERGAVSAYLARVAPGSHTPVLSIWAVWAMSCLYTVAGSFAELLEIFALVIWLFYGATGVALLRLRRRGIGSPLLATGFNSVTAPAVLLGAACVMTGLQVAEAPLRALTVCGLLAAAFWATGTISPAVMQGPSSQGAKTDQSRPR